MPPNTPDLCAEELDRRRFLDQALRTEPHGDAPTADEVEADDRKRIASVSSIIASAAKDLLALVRVDPKYQFHVKVDRLTAALNAQP